jgi:hypothetical protein
MLMQTGMEGKDGNDKQAATAADTFMGHNDNKGRLGINNTKQQEIFIRDITLR